jgi:hypothetical protein
MYLQWEYHCFAFIAIFIKGNYYFQFGSAPSLSDGVPELVLGEDVGIHIT